MRDLGIASALQAGKGGIPRGNLHLGKGEGLLGVTSPVKVRSFRSWGLRVQGLSQACWIATSRVGVAGCSVASLTLLAGSLQGSLKLLETKLQLFLERVRCPREFLVFSKQGQSSEDVEVAGPFGRRRWSRIFGRQETGR
ncbi:hypothetical protein NDU88_000579 [Pleurodeles waltl]|uniref:Uncharacterized protein n=1 Tax=Pleurodeles waltl TaxID=8319 RepID=A0AAV7V5G6_PLEWA|nr:hypothetical protein NDU88_000579 [Pleurodeles waltl]